MPRLSFNFVCILAVFVTFGGSAEKSGDLSVATTLIGLGYEEVPLRRTGENRLFLFASVDGRKRSCLVDSGWSFTTVSTNTAARLSDSNVINRLELGSVRLTNVSVRAQDVRVNGQPASFDIVLGCDFLFANHAVLDVANRRLYLRQSALSAAARSSLNDLFSSAKLAPAPMEIRDPPVPIVSARINGHEVNLLVDSGAMWSCLDSSFAAQMGLKTFPTANQISGVVGGGKRSVRLASVDGAMISTTKFRTVDFAILSLADWGFGPDGKIFPDVGGLLGGAELLRGGAVLDFSGDKLWLRIKP